MIRVADTPWRESPLKADKMDTSVSIMIKKATATR